MSSHFAANNYQHPVIQMIYRFLESAEVENAVECCVKKKWGYSDISIAQHTTPTLSTDGVFMYVLCI